MSAGASPPGDPPKSPDVGAARDELIEALVGKLSDTVLDIAPDGHAKPNQVTARELVELLLRELFSIQHRRALRTLFDVVERFERSVAFEMPLPRTVPEVEAVLYRCPRCRTPLMMPETPIGLEPRCGLCREVMRLEGRP